MHYRKLGRSDLSVPAVSFGAWAIGGWMWGGSDDADAVRALQAAFDAGVTCVDTAPVYGMGHSEQVVAEALRGRREEIVVATKCGLRWDREEGELHFETTLPDGRRAPIYKNLRPASIRWECEQSLQRLGVDHIDLYQCHWPDSTTPIADTMGELVKLQEEGKIRAIGMSNFTVPMLEECQRHGVVVSDQPKYNALEREIEAELLPWCEANDVAVLAWSPIAQGLLTGKVTPDREFPEGDVRRGKPLFSRENRIRVAEMLAAVQPIAEGHGLTLGQLFIAWTIGQPGLTSALVGARNAQQATENAKAGSVTLAPDELLVIREAVEAVALVPA